MRSAVQCVYCLPSDQTAMVQVVIFCFLGFFFVASVPSLTVRRKVWCVSAVGCSLLNPASLFCIVLCHFVL